MWDYGGMMGGWGHGSWWGLFGMFIGVIILIAVIVGIIWLMRSGSYVGNDWLGSSRRSSALDILEDRYARGEINREEYLEKKRDISA